MTSDLRIIGPLAGAPVIPDLRRLIESVRGEWQVAPLALSPRADSEEASFDSPAQACALSARRTQV